MIPVYSFTRVRSTTTKCTRGCGCNGHPAFPTPSLGESFINASGASRREGANARLMIMSLPRLQPSSPAKAGDPVFRGAGDRVEKPRRTGYSAFAEYDGFCEERKRRSNPPFLYGLMDCFASLAMTARLDGLLRGACHQARIRATRWLAMTERVTLPYPLSRRLILKT